MVVTLAGITVDPKFTQPLKASLPIDVTLFGILTSAPLYPLNAPEGIVSIVESAAKKMSAVTFLNAPLSILVTVFGICIAVKPVQSSKACAGIVVVPSAIYIVFKLAGIVAPV